MNSFYKAKGLLPLLQYDILSYIETVTSFRSHICTRYDTYSAWVFLKFEISLFSIPVPVFIVSGLSLLIMNPIFYKRSFSNTSIKGLTNIR